MDIASIINDRLKGFNFFVDVNEFLYTELFEYFMNKDFTQDGWTKLDNTTWFNNKLKSHIKLQKYSANDGRYCFLFNNFSTKFIIDRNETVIVKLENELNELKRINIILKKELK